MCQSSVRLTRNVSSGLGPEEKSLCSSLLSGKLVRATLPFPSTSLLEGAPIIPDGPWDDDDSSAEARPAGGVAWTVLHINNLTTHTHAHTHTHTHRLQL